jgi:hypothetical protein
VNNFWHYLSRAALIIGLGAPAAAALFWAIDVYIRMGKLEAQMQAIATAPAISRPSTPADQNILVNPIQQACAELARQAANESYVNRSYTVDLMSKLACDRH